MLGGNYEKFRLYIIKYKYIINNNRSNFRNMWVIIETKNHKRYTRVFKRKFIKYFIFWIINKIKGNKIDIIYDKPQYVDVGKTFKIIYSLCALLIIILLGLFIYCCYGLYRHKECENISFSTKSCERWKDF